MMQVRLLSSDDAVVSFRWFNFLVCSDRLQNFETTSRVRPLHGIDLLA